jgi:hypothetical protein
MFFPAWWVMKLRPVASCCCFASKEHCNYKLSKQQQQKRISKKGGICISFYGLLFKTNLCFRSLIYFLKAAIVCLQNSSLWHSWKAYRQPQVCHKTLTTYLFPLQNFVIYVISLKVRLYLQERFLKTRKTGFDLGSNF